MRRTDLIHSAAAKRYTFTIKDKLLPKDPDTGREQSTISYEYDFVVDAKKSECLHNGTKIFIPWSELKATYRGKEKKDAPKLDLRAIKRFSLLMRRCVEKFGPVKLQPSPSHNFSALCSAKCSIMTDLVTSFFGDQEGPFSISVRSISAVAKPAKDVDQDRSTLTPFPYPYKDDKTKAEMERRDIEKSAAQPRQGDGMLAGIWNTCTDCVKMR